MYGSEQKPRRRRSLRLCGTPAGIWFHRSYSKIWIALHEALAHLSSCGVHRIIEGTGHEIQLDKPQAVIDAVDEVLRQLHAAA